MTVPIHSVKHVKATYRKYQILALISASATILAVLLATLFSYQLGRVAKRTQQSTSVQLTSTSRSLNSQIGQLNQKIAELEAQSAKDKAAILSLEANTAELNRKLIEANQALKAFAQQAQPMPSGQETPLLPGADNGHGDASPPDGSPAPETPFSPTDNGNSSQQQSQ